MDTPKIPTLKDAQKPQVKIKGLGAGLTLIDRLKQFKKKDLAFILAGLGTLFMAPLAEHFMMAPESGDAAMSPGWGGPGGKGGSNLFGSGGSPYETNGGGMAPGSAIGGGGDIITPLNVRDPSSLIMGPGSAQQPPAGSVTPPAPPPTAPTRSDSDLKDALAGAASRAASAAVKRAPLPVPKVGLSGNSLRGLGVAGGGSSASAGMAAPGAAAGSTGGGGGGSLNLARSAPGYKGAAGPRGSGNPQGLDGTKKAGQNAGDAFSRAGNALANLNGAASEQIPTGGSGFNGNGQGGAGANDKAPGGGGPGGSKSVGESLAFIAAKERMMKDLELEFEKKKLNDWGLLWGNVRNDLIKSVATEGLAKPLGKALGGLIDGLAAGGAANNDFSCQGGGIEGKMPRSAMNPPCAADKEKKSCWNIQGTSAVRYDHLGGVATVCTGSGASTPDPKAEGDGVDGTGGVGRQSLDYRAASRLGNSCSKLEDEIKAQEEVIKKNPSDTTAPKKKLAAEQVRTETGEMIAVRDALTGSTTSDACGATAIRGKKSVQEYIKDALGGLLDEDGVPKMLADATSSDATTDTPAKKVSDAKTAHSDAVKLLGEAKNAFAEVDPAVFDTKEFGLNDATFSRISATGKQAHKGITAELPRFEQMLTDLDVEIKRSELALGTVKDVIATNKIHTAMITDAAKIDESLKTPPEQQAQEEQPAPAKKAPDAEAADVKTAITTAAGKVHPDAENAVKKMAEAKKEAEKKNETYTPSQTDKQPVLDTWGPLGDMQKAQIGVLNSVKENLDGIKTGKKPNGTTGTTPEVPVEETPTDEDWW